MTVLRIDRPRQDALPESTPYRDRGCDLHDACLTCPLPHCRYDVAGGARALLNRARNAEMRRLRLHGGLPVDEIARRFRVSRRTVFRVLQQAPRSAGPRETARAPAPQTSVPHASVQCPACRGGGGAELHRGLADRLDDRFAMTPP